MHVHDYLVKARHDDLMRAAALAAAASHESDSLREETMNSHARTVQPPAGQTPFDTLTGALGGLMVGHCLISVTNFRVADALGDTPQTAAELAAVTAHSPSAAPDMSDCLRAVTHPNGKVFE